MRCFFGESKSLQRAVRGASGNQELLEQGTSEVPPQKSSKRLPAGALAAKYGASGNQELLEQGTSEVPPFEKTTGRSIGCEIFWGSAKKILQEPRGSYPNICEIVHGILSMSPKALLTIFRFFPFFLALIISMLSIFHLSAVFLMFCSMPRVDPHVPHFLWIEHDQKAQST